MRLHVLQHDDNVHLGSLAAPLAGRDLDVVTIGWDDDLAPLDDAGAVLVLGGRATAVASERPDRIGDEIVALRGLLEREVPVFGLCLGAQLLAEAAGGEVTRRDTPELALVPLSRTAAGEEDDVAVGWPDGASAVLYHEDEVTTLPDDAVVLLEGGDGHRVWRLGSAYASQPHLEATAELVHGWLDSDRGRAFADAADIDAEAFGERLTSSEKFYTSVGASMVLRWLDALRRAAD